MYNIYVLHMNIYIYYYTHVHMLLWHMHLLYYMIELTNLQQSLSVRGSGLDR